MVELEPVLELIMFDYRFDSDGDLFDHTLSAWPYNEDTTPTAVTLPSGDDDMKN